MKVTGLDREFIVVGENVHCTRILLRKGKRIGTDPDGHESVLYPGPNGETCYLRIPEATQQSTDFQEGRVKHVQVAVRAAMSTQSPDREIALDYLNHVIQRQVKAGADFLDLNVDEISFKHDQQQEAMRWLVGTVQGLTDTPLSIDSSLFETIQAGLGAYKANGTRPLLNSASLERKAALDLAVEHNAKVIVTGAGESGMPENDEQRVSNASRMIDIALEKGIELGDIQVDLLVFPISVNSSFGMHYLDAVRKIREKYGPDIHITGGMSNVSFGLPVRRLVNDVFVNLAIDSGADAGIIDPVARNIGAIIAMDRQSHPYQLARQMLLGADRNCKTFLRAYRKGELQDSS